MQSDHRVAPGDDQHSQLDHAEPGRADRVDPQHETVIVEADVEKIGRDANVDDVLEEQQRDREAEHQLRPFRSAQPQAAALPQCPQCQRVMHGEAAVEQHLHRPLRPQHYDPAQGPLHCRERDQAHRMVEQMHRHVGQHHQAAREAQPPDHRGLPQFRRNRLLAIITAAL
jgi:hypothetical protein